MTRAWRRRARSSHTLPDGPGLAARWAMAVPLMLVAAFGPVVVAAVYRAWADQAFDELLNPGQSFLSFDEAFRENLPGSWPLALLPLGLTVGFLVRRNRMASWPAAVLGNAVVLLVVGAVVSLSVVDDPVPPKVALLGGVLVVCFWLGRAAEYVLSRPVATDVVRSRLEIPMRLPRQRPRLRVQENLLVLDRLRRRGSTRIAIPWHELTDVRWETVSSPTTWSPAPHAREIKVPAGPAVRIEAGKKTWLLPARSEELARAIVTGIDMRGH